MAKKLYVGVNNVAHKGKKIYVGVNNVARKVKKIYVGVNNVARQCYTSGSDVSYYDGNNLLGKISVDEGKSVLNPSGLTAQNLIPYPYYTQSSTIAGITYTVNTDGTIKVSGTATALSIFQLTPILNLEVGEQYILCGCPSGGSTSTTGYRLCDESTSYNDIGNGITFIADGQASHSKFKIRVAQGTTCNNLIFKPMVVKASEFSDVKYNDFIKFGLNKYDSDFIGWTNVRGSTTPLTSFVATGESMTLYAIYKYKDAILSDYVGRDGTDEWSYPDTATSRTINKLTINGDKYSSVTITVTAYDLDTSAWASHNYCELYAGVNGNLKRLVRANREGASVEYMPPQTIVSSVSTPYTFSVNVNTGTQYAQIRAEGGWYSWHVTISKVIATGRTVCK